MAQKRRKTCSPAPEFNKRFTRSSSRKNTAVAQSTPDDASDVKQKAPTRKRASKPNKPSGEDAKPKADTSSEPPSKDGISAPKNFITFNITHDLVNKPIQCHEYTPIPSPSTPSPTLIFTHGAGGTLSADAVVNFCSGFSSSLHILAFQGSMNLKSRTKGFHACIDELHSSQETAYKVRAKGEGTEKRLLLGGRSMGARAAVIAASEWLAERKDEEKEEGAVQLVLVSYPLQGPKDDLRDQILLDLPETVSVLFIIGDRDAMCPLDMLNETRSKMSAKSQLVVVRDADHGMHVKSASVTKEVGEETGRVAARWVGEGLERDVIYIGEEEE